MIVSSIRAQRGRRSAGFTLLELIIVIAVVGILAAMAVPNLTQTPRRAKEAVLKTNLRTLREVIDQFYADQGSYPGDLEELVNEGYLRDVPIDPITGEADWITVSEDELIDPDDPDAFSAFEDDFLDGGGPGIIDVYSASEDLSLEGEAYAEW